VRQRNRCIYTVFVLLLAFPSIYGQGMMDRIRTEYQDFNYNKVIELTREALQDRNTSPVEDVKDILLMQAIAYFSLNNLTDAAASFQDLLQIDNNYSLDPVLTSPKIIQFFNQIKSSLPKPLAVEKPARVDTVKVFFERHPGLPGAVIRSFVLPGWGQCYLDHSTKSKILTVLGVTTSAVAVYSIVDCHRKENDYLAEYNVASLEKKYQRYNNAYKLRNAFLFTYATLWLASQVDLLFSDSKDRVHVKSSSITPLISIDHSFLVSLRFYLH
jgi:hypothetical protein